jgi:hypothetical protein
MLYLHEIIDIVGTGQEPYMQTVTERARHSEGQGISRLMGCWKVIGSTNRWPQVVNLWEMDGWSHWARALERQFVPEKKDPALGPWWAKATEWRSGGFDRILEPAPYAPTLRELEAAKLRAWVFVHTIARARPGRGEQYLQAVGKLLRPVFEKSALSLFGAYRVPMRRDEVVLIWASADFAQACRIFESRNQGADLQQWNEAENDLLSESETMWLVPAEACFFHPQNQS